MIKIKAVTINKIIVFLLCGYILSIFLFDTNAEKLYITYFSASLLIIILLLKIYLNNKLIISYLVISYFPFLLLLLLGSLYSLNQSYSLIIIQTYLILFFLMILLVNTIDSTVMINSIINGLSVVAMIFILYILSVYSLSDIITSIRTGFRIGYDISQPNTIGYYSAVGSIILAYTTLNSKRSFLKYLSIVFLALSVLVILGTGSRRAILVLLVGIILISLFSYSYNWIKKSVIVIAIGTILFVIYANFLGDGNMGRIESLLSLFLNEGGESNSSDIVRKNLIEVGLKLFAEYPALGHGTGSYRFAVMDFYGSEVASHNNFIEIIVNHGMMGILAYYLPMAYVMYLLFKKIRSSKDSLGLLLLTLLIVDTFITGFAAYTYYDKYSIILLAICISYIMSQKNKVLGR